MAEGPIPENQRIERDFEAVLGDADTVFCRTDVVRGGKAADEKDPPPLDNQIRAIIAELRMDGSAWSAACSSVA